jgi:hypothetical protein
MEPQKNERAARYPVVFRVAPEVPVAGALVVHEDRLLLEGRYGEHRSELSVPYAEIAEVRIGRGHDERLNGNPVLLLERDAMQPIQIEPLGFGLLHELAELLTSLALENANPGQRVAVIVPLNRAQLARARELMAQGPPFDPSLFGFTRHEVFLIGDDAIFLFTGPHVRAKLARMTSDPTLWQVGRAWRDCIAGRPRIAAVPEVVVRGSDRPIYSWAA